MRRTSLIVVAVCVILACAAGALAVIGHVGTAAGRGAAVTAARSVHVAPAQRSARLHCRLRRARLHTLPDLRPPAFCVARRRGVQVAQEQILVTPRPDDHQHRHEDYGLMMLSGTGKLLWWMRRTSKVHDLKAVTYHGQPMLAFFERAPSGAYYELLDQHYSPVARIQNSPGLPTDEHELRLTPQGTAYLAAEPIVNVPGVGKVADYVVQEVDVATGKVLFQWRALDHVPLRDSFKARPRDGSPWDYFHGNAIDPPAAGDSTIVVSARNTSAIYGIDRQTGRTRWILGGRRDQFGIARHPDWRFCTQHDAHRPSDGRLVVFDNGGSDITPSRACPVHPARVLTFQTDFARKRVRLIANLSSSGSSRNGAGILSNYVGSARIESSGDMLIDWGHLPRITALRPDGREDLLLRLPYWSYRAAPARWVGRPPGAPVVATERKGGAITLWASWNGATEIRSWQVLAGSRPDALAPLGAPVPFADLETQISARTDAPFVAVRALDAAGQELGTSRAVQAR